jgi:hypothetical protein
MLILCSFVAAGASLDWFCGGGYINVADHLVQFTFMTGAGKAKWFLSAINLAPLYLGFVERTQ